MWGGYSEAIRAGLPVKFHRGGYSEAIRAELPVKFHVGGYSEAIRAGLPVKFHWGGILNFRIGVFCRIWTKISTTPAGSCITDSLSHTTYVETKLEHLLTEWPSDEILPQSKYIISHYN